ncbi:amidohydrolase [Lacibacter sediminis]|uniref:Amidohydrolase n=1 Tax=Lacibacter sediminis TaxID=2760713 RepID=A0A7G5XBK2_9BACT|nr:amidohydrolase [Lacibacter sediminis]QNA42855.1 amidohydrolase [Lacibacter sediminis]
MRKLFSLIVLCTTVSSVSAQNIQQLIDQRAKALLPKVIEWRRHLHQNPELGNREFKTMAYIANHLKSLGLEVTTGVAKTGVVAILKGGKPGSVVALRADIDALPIVERTNVPFKSTVMADYLGQQVPVMHACGHDTHVAILMGTAEVLATMKKDVPGTVKFIFQPAEEGPPGTEEGGAPLMVKEGVMDNPKVDAIFGLHIAAGLEIGKIKYKSGAFMASSDWFTIKVKGKGAHGSAPWSGIDPIMISAQIINGLQTIVSRSEDLTKAPVVITVGKFNGGVRENIIPEEVSFSGTIRTLDGAMQKDVYEKIRRTASNIAEALGGTAEVTIDNKTLVTYNTPALVSNTIASLQTAAGAENVSEGTWTTGAEDFSFFGEKAPAFFFNLGGMPKGAQPTSHHTPDFLIDDSMLDVGVKAFCNIVFDYGKVKK